jgi:hypothetical protein
MQAVTISIDAHCVCISNKLWSDVTLGAYHASDVLVDRMVEDQGEAYSGDGDNEDSNTEK